MTFEQSIAAFFKEYVDAFARADASALSALWEDVGLFPSPTGNFAMERAAFRDHCAALMDFYSRQGVVRPEGELLSATEIFPNVAQASMAYRMYGAANELIAEWTHFYVLRRTDHWRVSLTVADGELAAWTALGAQM